MIWHLRIIIWMLLVSYTFIKLSDFLTTIYALMLGATEVNPIVGSLIMTYGIDKGITVLFFINTTIIILFLWASIKAQTEKSLCVILAIIVTVHLILSGAVANNVIQIVSTRGII